MNIKVALGWVVLLFLSPAQLIQAQESTSCCVNSDAAACCDTGTASCCQADEFVGESCASLLPDCGDGLKPWTLPQPSFLQNAGIKVGGWLQQGITFNSRRPDDKFNGPVATNDLDGEWEMNQFWIFLERAVNTSEGGWDIGGRIDMLYGSDYRFGINNGLENRINGENSDTGFDRQTYGMVIPQMYLEVAIDKLSMKFGHFAAILDYEMIPAPANPFYSHSYSYGYTVPQLVTGFMADYHFTEQFSMQGSIHRGWMQFEDTNNAVDFMGGFKWASCDKRTSVAFAMSYGAQDPIYISKVVGPIGDLNGHPGDQHRFVYSLVCQQQVTENLKYVLVHNLGNEKGGALKPVGGDAEWYGLNNYLLYQINPKWSANVRFEWMRDDDGARIAGPGNIPGIRAWNGIGYAGNFYAFTMGANWRPLPTVVVRPEVRWDWYDGDAGFNPGGRPFDSGGADSQFTVACDAIIMF